MKIVVGAMDRATVSAVKEENKSCFLSEEALVLLWSYTTLTRPPCYQITHRKTDDL